MQGLATALSQISSANVTATPSINGNIDSIAVTLSSTTRTPAAAMTLSASGNGDTLSTTQSLTQATTRALSLTFGCDFTNPTQPVFEVQSASISSNNELSNFNLSGNATIDGVSQTVMSGGADIVANISSQFDTSGGPLTADELNAAAVQTTINGSAALSMIVAGGSPVTEEAVSVKVPDIANPASEIFDPGQVQPSPLAPQVSSVIQDFSNELGKLESQINAVAGFASDLPFIGKQLASDLNPANLFQPISYELSALQSTISQDLADSTTLLTKLQSDIVSALSRSVCFRERRPTMSSSIM